MKAYIFPGQGAQFSGMGLDLFENSAEAQELFKKANAILGFSIKYTSLEKNQNIKSNDHGTKVTNDAIPSRDNQLLRHCDSARHARSG